MQEDLRIKDNMQVNEKRDFKPWPSISGFLFLICILAGAVVMGGWFAGSTTITQIHPDFAPMQFNTALGIFLLGCGVFSFAIKQTIIPIICALLCLILGGATIVEYVWHIDLGLDQLFVHAEAAARTSHPGRMSPTTASSFILMGLAILAGLRVARITHILLAVVTLLGFLSLISYAFGDQNILGGVYFSRMAIHTASAFIIAALALFIALFVRNKTNVTAIWNAAPYSTTIFVLIMTAMAWFPVYESIYLRNLEHFERKVDDMQYNLQKRYLLYEQSLWGGVGLFNGSDFVNRTDWQRYVDALNIKETLPGVNGLGFIELVQEDELEDFIDNAKLDGVPYFRNHPKTQFSDKFIIKYIVPQGPNEEAVGLDIGFEAHRREAAERARDTGKPALTKTIQLVQDNVRRPGFLFLIPVYEPGSNAGSANTRRQNFQGWIYAPIIGDDFLEKIYNMSLGEIEFSVFDGADLTPDNLIYASNPADPVHDSLSTQLVANRTMSLGGREWNILWAANENYSPPLDIRTSYFIALLGVAFAVFLYFILSKLVQQRAIIDQKMQAHSKIMREAEAANQAKSDFLANMSHELRTPLNSILGMVQLIQPAKLEDNARTMFETISKSSRSLLTIVNDILDLSKIEAGEVKLENIGFDAFASARYVVRALTPHAKAKGLELICECASSKILVLGDPLRFERIITNLVNNALRYTDEGRVIVRLQEIPKDDGSSDLSLRGEVIDTGIGIAEESRVAIFQKFTQADTSDTRRYGGTGLGLAITQGLVELMKGTIGLDSEVGKGTTFWFEIPYNRATHIAGNIHDVPAMIEDDDDQPINDEDALTQIEGARILIVEDHEMNQLFMKKLMENLNIQNYKIAVNGAKAVEELEANEYDLVLMDCHMPVMNGYDATRAIREMDGGRYKDLPIVAMTANAMSEDRQKCLDVGMNDYMSKPVDVKKFKDILRRYVLASV